MNKKTIFIVLIVIILTVVTFFLVSKKSNRNESSNVLKNEESVGKNQGSAETEIKVPGTTIDGMIVSIDDKSIVISNGTPEGVIIGITAKTPVIKVKKDGTETSAGLADVVSGTDAKVLFASDSLSKKMADKIYLIEK